MRQPTANFHVGQRVVCVDASLNRLHSVKLLSRGKIYVVRGIDDKPGWHTPGWGCTPRRDLGHSPRPWLRVADEA
jgi:hypothetical protein